MSTCRSQGAVRLRAVLLTDVEASTRAWFRHGPAMAESIDVLDRCVTEGAARFDGEVVKARGEGDSHFVAFELATSAVQAAVAIQRAVGTTAWPDGGPALRVRAAVHVGEVRRVADDFQGHAINVAARLRSTAHGEQIVTGRAVVELAAAELRSDVSFRPLGRHRVRDLPGWTEIHQVDASGLRRDFPALVTIDHGLPPVAAIVVLDVVGHTANVERLSPDDEAAAWALITSAVDEAFARSDGQYLKHVGDGCLALFADPHHALAFARAARRTLAARDVALRAAIDVGRVTFANDEPIGRPIREAVRLLRDASSERIALTPAACALLAPDQGCAAVSPRRERGWRPTEERLHGVGAGQGPVAGDHGQRRRG